MIDMYDEQPGEAGQLSYLLGQIGERRAELERRRQDIEDSLAELADLERRCEADLRRTALSRTAPYARATSRARRPPRSTPATG